MFVRVFGPLFGVVVALVAFGQGDRAVGRCDECDVAQYAALGDMVATGSSSGAACRITAGNACGSGSFVGKDATSSFVMTNAHVVGTTIGRVVALRFVENGRVVNESGRVVMAAYSDRMLTDWAVVRLARVVDVPHVAMSKTRPSGDHYTTGSPRCVWPLQSTAVRTADVSQNSSLWRWRPNAIGGQSGSGVWSVNGKQEMFGLLTWSWGGLGAGQQTAVIWKQTRDRSIDADNRPAGLQEVGDDRSPTEVGFFSEVSLGDLPIWGDGDGTTPPLDQPVNDRLRRILELIDQVVALLRTLVQ